MQKLHEVCLCIAGEKLPFFLCIKKKLEFLLFLQIKQLDFVDS